MKIIPDYSAGTASVRLTPDARSFLRDMEAKLRAIKDPRFTIAVDADTAQAKADIERFRQMQQRGGMKLGVDVALGQAQTDMAAFRARQQRDGLVVKVDADTGKARAELASLDSQLTKLSRRQLGWVNVGAAGAAAFQPTVTALAEVAASIQQVSQAGLALPGIFAGAAASVGTLVMGLSGIKDAYDAVSDAAASSGKDAAQQARAQVSASNNLRNAVVDEARAREDVVRATRQQSQELRDLRTEQRGGMIDESRAILEAQKAREALAKGDYTDVRDQLLQIQEADQRVIEVRNRNATTAERLNDINRTGVQGTDAVVDANERLTRTMQATAEAQMAAADAATQSSAAQDKAAEALGKIGPNAAALVTTLQELTPQFQAFRTAISDPLLAGKAEEFEDFFTRVRPVAERGLAGIAEGWNQNISAFLGAVGSDRGTGLIDRILGNTGDAQKRLTAAISPMVEGIGVLTAAGTDVLPRLADGFGGVMDRFRDFIVAADEDGRLDKWINDGIDGVSSLGNSMLNVGKTFTAITKAVGGGGEFLQWLETATGRLQTFLNSTEGQAKLQEYFDQGREAIRQVMPLLEALPGALQAIGEGASLYVGGGLLPVLTTVAQLLGDHPTLVSTAVAAWLAFKTVGPVMGAVQTGINTLNNGLIGIGTNFAATRAKGEAEVGRINKAFDDAGKPNSKLGTFSKGVGALAFAGGPFGILATTIASVAIPGLVALADNMDTAAERTEALKKRQEELETTLDRVTGKLTSQSLDKQLTDAQNYDAPGIGKRDALDAATKLGISPDLYGQALLNDPAAQKQVRDVLIKNNLLPEFQANKDLGKTAAEIGNLTGGAINQDALLQALIGAPGAVDRYDEELRKGAYASSNGDATTAEATINRFNLAKIAGGLSQTGLQSIVAGGFLTTATAQMPTGGPTVQRNQAQNGVFSLSDAGKQLLGGNWQVTATGPKSSPDTKYSIAAPPGVDLGPQLEQLRAQGIEATYNEYDRSWDLVVPKGSPLVKEGFKVGGPTPGGRNQGFLAELHGQEFVHDAGTVDRYGPEVMNAMWRGQIDPKAIKSLVPGFWWGGPTDPNDPNNPNNAHGTQAGAGPNVVGIATGQAPGGVAPGPVAPNTFTGTVPGVVTDVTAQATSPLANIGGNLLGQFGVNVPGLQGTGAGASGGTGLTPGLWGLAEAGNDPLKQQMWQKQTLDWVMNDWVGGTIVGGLMNSVLPEVLGAVGLGGILNSPIVSGFTKGLNHFMSMGGNNSQAAGVVGGMVVLPDGTQMPVEQFLTPTVNGAGGQPLDTAALLQQLYGGGAAVTAGSVTAGVTVGGDTGGLQINTARGKAVIQQNFPWATNIGGVRQDRLKWHPQGLALDVMIPGAGDLNDPTPPAGKAQGDQLYSWLMAHQQELGIDYIMWQEKDHFNHLHVNFAPSGFGDGSAPPAAAGVSSPPSVAHGGAPGAPAAGPAVGASAGKKAFRFGGHTPGSPSTPIPAVLHGDEFVHRNEAVEKYGLDFMNAVNDLRLDPSQIPHLAAGGMPVIRAGAVIPKPPPPRPPQVIQMKPKAPPMPLPVGPKADPNSPLQPIPGGPADPNTPLLPGQAPAPPDGIYRPPPVAVTPPTGPQPAGPPSFAPAAGAGASGPGGPTDYTLPWVNQAIESGASAIGSAVQTAAAVGSMGAAGAAGGAMGGMGGLSIQGLFQQGGKIVQGVANIISGAMVGSVPGSFMTTPEAYGRTQVSEPRAPQTAMPSYQSTYHIQGVDSRNMLQELSLRENIQSQAALAAHPDRV